MQSFRVGNGIVLLLVLFALASHIHGQSQAPAAYWSFDAGPGVISRDRASDRVEGLARFLPGVSGKALCFDGYSTHVIRKSSDAPQVGDALTIEAWVVIDAYPWNWVPIVDHSQYQQVGYYFGIDAFGHLGLQVALDGVWLSLSSTAEIPLKKWTHVVGTYQAGTGLTLYMNGKETGKLPAQGRMRAAERADLWIGRVREPMMPVPADAIHPRHPVEYSFDGILDEIRIHTRSLDAREVERLFTDARAPEGEVLPWAALPAGPPGAGPFGAYYASLKFHDAWDALRRVGRDSDVVVRFDHSPTRLVFWQGTNYIPAWVTENGKWYTDEFLETYREACPGDDCEPMSDKQSRYSRVRILESTDARVVVHWRYALSEAERYLGALPDPQTGWFDWADEYWAVYPDGVAVRHQLLWSTDLSKDHEWHETIVINAPGQRPEDNIHLDALTIVNMQGETATYTWKEKPFRLFERPHGPEKVDRPDNPSIQWVNLKSAWKPFQIVPPQNVKFDIYNSEKTNFTFECWNHWPVGQIPSSGRPCVATDRVSHTSLSHIRWEPYRSTDRTMSKLLLTGLTTKSAAELLPLAKSWITPPGFEVVGEGFRSEGYDPAERAFVVSRDATSKAAVLDLTFHANDDSPLVNPAVVVRNWNSRSAQISIDAKAAGKDVRSGFVEKLDRMDLIVFIPLQSTKPMKVRVSPGQSK